MNDFAFLNLFGTLSSRSHHPLGSSGPLRRRWVPCQGWPKAWMCSDPVNPWRIFLFMGDMNQNQSIIFLLVIIQWKPYEEFWIWDLFLWFKLYVLWMWWISSLRFECFKKHPVKMKQMKHLHQMVWKCTLQHSLLQDAESQSVYWVCLASGQDGSWAVFSCVFLTIPVQKQWFSKWYS